MFEGSGGQYGRCGTEQGSHVHRDPGWETPGSPGRDGSAAEGSRGTWEVGGIHAVCPWLEVTFGLEWPSSFVPVLFVEEGTHVCVFAEHLVGAPPAQLSLQESVIACHWIKPL